MSVLYIRKRPSWLTFVNSVDELREIADNLVPGQNLILADLACWSNAMLTLLLKLVEENPAISVYSSTDSVSEVLFSRFSKIEKDPLGIKQNKEPEKFERSPKEYHDILTFMSGYQAKTALYFKGESNRFINLVTS
jgi:hypothetical protein